jgi:hypothetical protein
MPSASTIPPSGATSTPPGQGLRGKGQEPTTAVLLNGEQEIVAKAKNAESAVTSEQTLLGLFTYGLSYHSLDHGFTLPAGGLAVGD